MGVSPSNGADGCDVTFAHAHAGDTQIKALRLRWHPDKNPILTEFATEVSKVLNAAVATMEASLSAAPAGGAASASSSSSGPPAAASEAS